MIRRKIQCLGAICWRGGRALGSRWPTAGAAAVPAHPPLRVVLRTLFGFAKNNAAPVIPPKPATRTAYGHEWQDEYSWLERPSRRVEALLRREQEYYESWMQGTQRAQHALLRDMLRLLPEEQVTSPERVGPYLYYVRQMRDRTHPCYVRRRAHSEGPWTGEGGEEEEEVLLDVNELARVYGDAVSVAQVKLSQCDQRLAFTLDPGDGSEQLAGFVRDLRSGRLWQPRCLGGVVSLEWAGDNRTLLYTQPDPLGRPSRVLRCDALTPGSGQGETLFEEANERFFVELSRTKDWAYLAINCNSKISSEVRLIPADEPRAPPRLVCDRRDGLEYFVEHHQGRLLLLSNARGAENYALYSAPAPPEGGATLGPEGWELVVPEREGVAVEDMDVFEDAVVLYERHGGRPAVAVLPMGAGGSLRDAAAGMRQVPLPDWALSVSPGANADFRSRTLRLTLSSPIHPDAVFDYHLPSRQLGAVRQPEQHQPLQPRQSHETGRYRCTLLWAQSADGTAVPLTVARAVGAEAPAGGGPCLLVAYGAYGHCLPTDFQPERVALLERGWVVAFAHVRGGGELGRRWHAAGRAGNKGRSVDDLEACLNLLLATGLAREGRVALEALSAGGLTAGALLNRRPSELAAAVLEVPFVDLLTAICDPSLPLTAHEYDEWGDPSDPAAFDQLQRLCPYQNIRPHDYPATLVTCSQTDTRVPFWGPLKYAARLRAAQRGGAPVLLLPDAHEGHFSNERDRFHLRAAQYAFLEKALLGEGGAS